LRRARPAGIRDSLQQMVPPGMRNQSLPCKSKQMVTGGASQVGRRPSRAKGAAHDVAIAE